MTKEEEANAILARFEAGELDEAAAITLLEKLGVHPDHAREMLAIARGESDVVGGDQD